MTFDPQMKFEVLFDEKKPFDKVGEEDDLKESLAKAVEAYSDKKRKIDNERLTKELSEMIKIEIQKLPVVQKVIEKTLEKTLEKETVRNIKVPVYIEPNIVEAPPAPPQIIKEIRVEVEKKDKTKYAKEDEVSDLNKKLEKRIKDLTEELDRVKNTFSMMGGSGVIGIPPPEPNPVGYVLTINPRKIAEWKAATGSGGIAPGTFTITNNTPDYTFDATGSTVDDLYQVVATLIRTLQGEI